MDVNRISSSALARNLATRISDIVFIKGRGREEYQPGPR